jgi:Gp37 protein
MVSYEVLENNLISRLAVLQPSVEVEAMPDREIDTTVPFNKPRVSIMYQHSQFSPSLGGGLPEMFETDITLQDEFCEVHFVIRSRLLRGINGVYFIIAKVADLITGFKPTPWGRFYLKEITYLDNASGIWTWNMVFTARRPLVQAKTDDDGVNYPLVNTITNNINLQ